MANWLLIDSGYAWKYHLGMNWYSEERGKETTVLSSEKARVIKFKRNAAEINSKNKIKFKVQSKNSKFTNNNYKTKLKLKFT